jgi:hypothetical protein
VTVRDIRRVLDTMDARKLSPSTRSGTMTALSAAFRYAVKQGRGRAMAYAGLSDDSRANPGKKLAAAFAPLDGCYARSG